MKLLSVLVVALTACQGNSSPKPAPGSAAPPVTPPVVRTAEVCTGGVVAVEHASCGSAGANLDAAKAGLEGTVAAMMKAGDGDIDKYDLICSRMLFALERDTAKLGCTLPIEPALRTRMMELLDRYFAQRTPVTKTGDPAADDVIAKIAAMRDAACACSDQSCLDKLQIPQIPSTLPAAARDLATKLLDDASRCAQRIGLRQ